jgi:uracil permease
MATKTKALRPVKKVKAPPSEVVGYMPQDTPPLGATLSLGFQQVLTMFPATVLVAILTKFDVGVTLFASGLGTIVALLVSKRRIPLYYGSSFSYITVIVTVMALYAPACFGDPTQVYCPDGVRLAQVGIIFTGVINILVGLVIQKIGKARLDLVLPPIVTGSVAIVIGIALAGAALGMASANWLVAFITLILTIAFSVYLQGKGLIGMLPILLGAVAGYAVSLIFDLFRVPGTAPLVNFGLIAAAPWLRLPSFTLPAFTSPDAWSVAISVALIAIATIPESTAHLYQMSLYIDQLAKDIKREPLSIKNLIGLNLIADGCNDAVNGFLGGCAGTNYGENNSLMAITRNYSVIVLMAAGGIAMALGFIGKLAAVVNTIPIAVTGGLAIYLFGVIGKQGVALIQSEKVNLFDPKNLAIGSVILVLGIGGAMGLPDGIFPFNIPVLFPNGIPAIVFAAIVGILLNVLFIVVPPSLFGVEDRADVGV